jgi:galacturan 1,4-alpha-galacturonidase
VLIPNISATMKLSSFLQVAALATTAAAKSCLSRRPTISPSPYQPRLPVPNPPRRHKVCVVEAHGDGVTDDSDHILSAFHECNDGGHVVFSRDETYTIGTAMDWTFLKHIDIGTASCN